MAGNAVYWEDLVSEKRPYRGVCHGVYRLFYTAGRCDHAADIRISRKCGKGLFSPVAVCRDPADHLCHGNGVGIVYTIDKSDPEDRFKIKNGAGYDMIPLK